MNKRVGAIARQRTSAWGGACMALWCVAASLGAQGAHGQELAADVPPAALPGVTVKARRDATATEGSERYTVRATAAATRLSLSPRETPQSISVITRGQMDDFNLQSANDVLSLTPGVTVNQVETERSYYSSRGFDISNFQFDGVGVPFTNGDQLGDIDTALFDRVEVLRGANGLLSSTGNPAATVNFVRKRPTADFRASAGLTVGRWNKRRLEADVSGGLNAQGSVRGRVIAVTQKSDSWMDTYSLDKDVVAALVDVDLGSSTVLSAGVSRQRNRPQGTAWGGLPLNYRDGSPTDYDRSTSAAPRWSHWDNSDTTGFVELAHRLGQDWQVKAVLSRRTLEADGALFSISGGLPDPVTATGPRGWISTQVFDETQDVLDLHGHGSFEVGGRRHELMLGAQWVEVDYEASYVRGSTHRQPLGGPETWENAPRPVFNGATGEADFVNRRRSLYAAVRVNPSDQWKVIAGLNVTSMDSSGEGFGGVERLYDKTKAVPYVGAVVNLNPTYSAYASYAAIYQPQVEEGSNGQPLDPTEGTHVEAGLKGEWFDKKLNATFSVFRNKQSNIASFVVDETFEVGGYHVGEDATSTGFELEVTGQVLPGWELSAGYTQLRLEDGDGEDTRTYIPRRTFRLSTAYRVPALPALKLGATVRWQSATERVNGSDATGTAISRQGAYALLGLMARYDFSERVHATLTVDNVTDKTYYASLYWDQSLYGAPRHASLRVNWAY